MKIAPTSFPVTSILNTKQYNYADSFVGDIADNENKIVSNSFIRVGIYLLDW